MNHLLSVNFANYNISNCVSFVYLVICCRAKHNNTLLMTFTIEKLADIEAHLNNHPTLSEGGAPGALDATIYLALGSTFLFIQKHPIDKLLLTFTIGTFSSPPSPQL